jgi:GNAT superfamily N-acetyltransferase
MKLAELMVRVMNQDYTVRPIKKDELDDLLDLYTHHLFPTPDAPLPPRPEVEALWAKIIANPLLHYFVVVVEGKVVATCTITIILNLTRGTRPYGLIENVVTHAAYRGRGLAKALFKYTLDFAWSENCYKVMLLSGTYRQAAHGLYESVGFSNNEKIGYVAKPPI